MAGVGLAAIASGCTALTSLDLTDCLQLRDEDLRAFAWGASEGVLKRFPDPKRDAELLMRKLWGGKAAAAAVTSPNAVSITSPSNAKSLPSATGGAVVPGLSLTVDTRVGPSQPGSPTPMGITALTRTGGGAAATKGTPMSATGRGKGAPSPSVGSGGVTARSGGGLSEASSAVAGKGAGAGAGGVNALTDAMDDDLPLLVASLKRLVLDGCFSIGDRGITSMARRCRGLTELSVSVRAPVGWLSV